MSEIVDQAVGQITGTARTAVTAVEDHYQNQLAQQNEMLLTVKAELDAEKAKFTAHMAEYAPAGHAEAPERPVCPPGTDREGQEIPDGETEAWCTIEQPPVAAFPIITGIAVSNDQATIDDRQARMGPFQMSRDYEASKGVGDVQRYSWYSSIVRQLANPADDNFRYLFFSVDNPWEETSSGSDKGEWEALLNSLQPRLPGVKGVICLGNETNIEAAEGAASDALSQRYRAALEKLIDTFGHQPVPGWMWGTAFSNHRSWGQGRTEGEKWLPRRPDGLFAVATHIYGKDDYTDPQLMIGRTFIPAMKKRPKWIFGVGETSAQEDPPGGVNEKAEWFRDCYRLLKAEGGSFWLPFDTNVGGSADVGSSPVTAAAVKECSQDSANNRWVYPAA